MFMIAAHSECLEAERVRLQRIQELDQQCYDTLSKGYQMSTLRNIWSQALIYSKFCEFYGFQMFPAGAWQLVRYARYVANTVTSQETVLNYLAGVRKLHQLAGFQVPGPDEPNMKHLMRALKQELAHPVKQAVPVTPQLLKSIYNCLDLTSTRDVVSYTALLVGFYLFLRRSNLVPDSRDAFDPQKQLTRSDVQMGKSMVLVVIKWSKVIQYKEKELLLPLLPARDIRICPVFWLGLMMSKVRAGDQDPLFALPEGSGVKPLTSDSLSDRYKMWVSRVTVLTPNHTLHGLRRGGACHALEVGLAGEDLKILGDWASDAYMRYIDLTLQRRVDNMLQFMKDL